jgi:hypothetical protein
MRRVDWLEQIREQGMKDRLYEKKGIWTPGARVLPNWPICMTCSKQPHSVELVDEGSSRLEIRVKCTHKAFPEPSDPEFEDSVKVSIPSGLSQDARDEQIGWALRNVKVFDPSRPKK